jgi:hypothetical protein
VVGTVSAKRLGGLEIDRQLELWSAPAPEVGWLLALEDAIDILGHTAILVDKIRPVGDQAAAATK